MAGHDVAVPAAHGVARYAEHMSRTRAFVARARSQPRRSAARRLR
ncbi:hypothetical protein STRIP9103_05542 [Streptomyces ipomoeae 91-03]|uniref:Uncharacterized protein n=1 Tax=Streptomyces ipomoeae 91-03 TaxID=698759 RepID=L1KMI9_9ACTN|nr:hypothetical protein STRIP9103_05542 [Streptomyces ipomoeae 91-03]